MLRNHTGTPRAVLLPLWVSISMVASLHRVLTSCDRVRSQALLGGQLMAGDGATQPGQLLKCWHLAGWPTIACRGRLQGGSMFLACQSAWRLVAAPGTVAGMAQSLGWWELQDCCNSVETWHPSSCHASRGRLQGGSMLQGLLPAWRHMAVLQVWV